MFIDEVLYRNSLGGTNIAAGIVDKTGKIIAKDSVPTLNTRPIEAIMLDMTKLCKTLLDKSQMDINKIETVGMGARERWTIKMV